MGRNGEPSRRVCSTRASSCFTIRFAHVDGGHFGSQESRPLFASASACFIHTIYRGVSPEKPPIPSDIINTRLIIEHILDEKRGLGYNLELVGFHGLTWRADGHQVTTGGKNGFNTFGVQPALQYRLGDHWVGAAGALFTVAGQNTQEAIFPNFSIYYYWGKNGTVIMR